MTNINVRIAGSANLKGVNSEFARLESSVARANVQLAQMVNAGKGVDVTGFNRMNAAVGASSQVFNSALASTGMFEVQQVRLNDATDDYVKKLQKQKLSFRDMRREWKVAKQAYREQLALNEQTAGLHASGTNKRSRRSTASLFFPTEINGQTATLGNRMAWLNEHLKSGATQMQNWGKNTQWAGRQLMVGLTLPIAAAGAAMGVFAFQVDKELTRIAKVYDTTADSFSKSAADMMEVEKELAQLRVDGMKTAVKAAKEYGYAAEETLAIQGELAATGITGQELQETTTQVMRISRLGEIDHQDALKSTIALQTVFRQNTDELAASFDYMNAIENATSLSTQDFAEAIPIAAAPIKAFGGDVKELGILLTAMKSRGIEATQGANAIKAAMQRLGRPSKQVVAEFKELTGMDIQELVDTSGSLTEVFSRLNDATSNLSDAGKRDVFAGLFGSYQVTRMSALVEGINDLNDGTSQVARAAEIAGQGQEHWADIAEREMDKLQESASFKFQAMIATIKAQLGTIGGPILDAANGILGVVSKIVEAFTNLPGIVKKGLGFLAAGVAIAGPLVMLTGLLGNLVGTSLKGIGAFAGLLVHMKIASKEGRVAAFAADLATKGYVDETMAVHKLTLELQRLVDAQEAANAASLQSFQSTNPVISQATPTANPATSAKNAATSASNAVAANAAVAANRSAQAVTQNAVSAAKKSAQAAAPEIANAMGTSITAHLNSKANYARFLANAPKAPVEPEKAKRSAYRRTDETGRKALDAQYKTEVEQYKQELKEYKHLLELRQKKETELLAEINRTLPDGHTPLTAAQLAGGGGMVSAPTKGNKKGSKQAREILETQQAQAEAMEAVRNATAETNAVQEESLDNMEGLAEQAESLSDNVDDAGDGTKKASAAAMGMATAMGAATIATALLQLNLGETTNKIATWTLTTSMLVPAIVAAGAGVKVLARGAVAAGKAMKAAAVASAAMAGGTKAAMVSMIATYAPLVLIVGAITAIGLKMWDTHKKNEKAKKDNLENARQVAASGKKYADEVGRAYELWSGIKRVNISNGNENFAESQRTYWNQNDEGKGQVKNFREKIKNGGLDEEALAVTKYTEALTYMGMTADDAEVYVATLFESLGKSDSVAAQVASSARLIAGETKESIKWADVLAVSIDQFRASYKDAVADGLVNEDFKKRLKSDSEDMVRTIVSVWNDPSTTAGDRVELFGWMKKELVAEADELNKWIALNVDTDFGARGAIQELSKMGVESSEELRKFIIDKNIMTAEDFVRALFGADYASKYSELQLKNLRDAFNTWNSGRDQIMKEWAKQQGFGDIKGTDEIEMTLEFKLSTADPSEIGSLVEEEAKSIIDTANKKAAGMADLIGRVGIDVDLPPLSYNLDDLEGVTNALTNLDGINPAAADEFRTLVNTIADENGYKRGADAAETYLNIIKGIRAEVAETAKYRQGGELKMKWPEITELYRKSMASVQSEMADLWQTAFDDERDAALDAQQEYWDGKMDALENDADREKDRFDREWKAKEDRVDAYWKKRIDAVNEAIEAEKKADEERQKMFDAEIARIRRLSEAANLGIDFNVALNKGDLDEAARISNTQNAQDVVSLLEAAKDAGTDGTDARTDKLENRIESLEAQRDRRKKALEKQKDDEKKILDDTLSLRKKNLQQEIDADMKAQRRMWENQKRHLDDKIKLFMAYTPRNEKELKKHTKNVGLEYQSFGDTLDKTTDSWASHWNERLKFHLSAGAEEMSNSHVWSNMSKGAMKHIIKGLGFKGKKEFNKWANSWKDYDTFGATTDGSRSLKPGLAAGADVIRHEGGFVGGGGGSSRKGVAKTLRGLHSSESMVLARKKEFIVNERAAAANADILHRINNGENMAGHGTGGSEGGLSSMLGAIAVRGLLGGVMARAKAQREAQTASIMSGVASGVGTAGGWTDEQMQNASIIRNVGKNMGMSGRDILIGLMTALQESGLRNIDYGDRDSVGLFQQRTSQGWGTIAQIMNPEYSAKKFFEGLKALGAKRNDMRLTEAAQAVQRSAYPEAYAKHEATARAMLAALTGGSGKKGAGKYYFPGDRGKGWSNSHDYRNGARSPLYSFANGVVVESRAIKDANGNYRSYGETIVIQDGAGNRVRYAHLDPGQRYVNPGDVVRGGQLIGRSGTTGNSTGYHTHFEVNGSENARQWFAQHGIPLKKGGTVQRDGTPAVLHKNERVLTAGLTKKLDAGIDMFFNLSKRLGGGGFSKLLNLFGGGPRKFGRMLKAGNVKGIADLLGFSSKSRKGKELTQVLGAIKVAKYYGVEKKMLREIKKRSKSLKAIDAQRAKTPWAGGLMNSGVLRSTEAFTGLAGISPDRTKEAVGKKVASKFSPSASVLRALNIPSLSVGGNIKWDNTIANLHRDEKVLTAPLSKKLDEGINNLAAGAGDTYNITVNAQGANIDEDILVTKIVKKIERTQARKPQSRRVGSK